MQAVITLLKMLSVRRCVIRCSCAAQALVSVMGNWSFGGIGGLSAVFSFLSLHVSIAANKATPHVVTERNLIIGRS